MFALCDRQIINVFDPRVSLLHLITSPLLGRILLTKSRSKAATRIVALHVIATVNRELDKLTGCTEQHRPEQHLKISTAIAAYPVGVFGLYEEFEKFFVQQAHSLPWEESRIGHLSVDRTLIPATMDRGHTIFCGAIVLGNLSLVKSMASSVDINTVNYFFGQPLGLASIWGYYDIMQYLLDQGANPHWVAKRRDIVPSYPFHIGLRKFEYKCPGGSALAAAVLGGNKKIVSLLLKPELRLPDDESEYFRAILSAVRIGRSDLIDQLLQITGRTLSDYEYLREAMLWEAVYHNQEGIVRLLLDHGANPNHMLYPDMMPRYPLHVAAMLGHDRLVHMLLEDGADMYVDDLGHMPIIYAARAGQVEVIKVLVRHGEKFEHALSPAASRGQVHLIKYLLHIGVDIHYRESGHLVGVGLQALFSAILCKNLAIISLLAAAGVPLNNDDTDIYEDPIWAAKAHGGEWVLKHLLSLGAEDRDYPGDKQVADPDCLIYERLGRGLCDVNPTTWKWQGKY